MGFAAEAFSNMTLEEKVGQLIISRGFRSSTLTMLRKGVIGGVSSNFIRSVCGTDIKKIMELTNQIRKESKIPPLFFTDCEKGLPQVFRFGTEFPSNMAVAATGDTELAYRLGKAIAQEAKALGYHIITCPVLDVNLNPDNPYIGVRSFSDDAHVVAEYANRYIDGVQEEGVIACGKHFPGMGDIHKDPRVAIPVVDKGIKGLKNNDFYPFQSAVQHGIRGMMTTHVFVPAIQKDEEVPVTFSRKAIVRQLKGVMNFNGLIVSDSLSVQTIISHYSSDEVAVIAAQAGNDLLLHDYNSEPMEMLEDLLKAVKDKVIPKKELDQKVMKILQAKEWCGAYQRTLLQQSEVEAVLQHEEHLKLSEEIIEKSITVLENKELPLSNEQEILIISARNDERTGSLTDLGINITAKAMTLYEAVKERNGNTAITTISEAPDNEEISRTLNLSKKFKHVIVANYVRMNVHEKGGGTLPEQQIEFIRCLAKQNKSVTTLIFGNPYVIAHLPKTANILVSYTDSDQALQSMTNILFGLQKPSGKLPVKISRKYVRGYGLV